MPHDDHCADVVVVGGGVIGASIALRLSRDDHRVTLVDPELDPLGSASRAAGAMLGVLGEVTDEPSSPTERLLFDLRVRAARLWEQWLPSIREVVDAPDLARGTFIVASSDRRGDQAAVDAMEVAAKREGLSAERVTPEDVPGYAPAGRTMPHRLLFLADEAWVDAGALLDSTIAAARATGRVDIVHDFAVDLQIRPGATHQVVTRENGTITAATVVLCAGTQVQAILEQVPAIGEAGPLHVVSGKGVGLRLEPRPSPMAPSPFRNAIRTPNREFACGLHLLPQGTGVYLGSTNRVTRWRGITGDVTGGEIARLIADASREVFAPIDLWNLASAVHGERPMSVDGNPLVGATAVEGVLVATGTYRNGVLLAPLVADAVADELAGREGLPEIGLGPSRVTHTLPPDQVLTAGLREYAELLQDPQGPAAGPDLGLLLATLGRLALEQSDEANGLRAFLRDLLTELPIVELVPEALIEVCEPELMSEEWIAGWRDRYGI